MTIFIFILFCCWMCLAVYGASVLKATEEETEDKLNMIQNILVSIFIMPFIVVIGHVALLLTVILDRLWSYKND